MLTSTDNKNWAVGLAQSGPQYLYSAAICEYSIHVMMQLSAFLTASFLCDPRSVSDLLSGAQPEGLSVTIR